MRASRRDVDSEMERLAAEQAALRRVATLVARGIAPEGVFAAVATEVSELFGADVSAILRFESGRTVTVLADVGGPHEAGARVTLDPGYVVDAVRETSHSARFDTENPKGADTGSLVRSLGVHSAVASPIIVEGDLWGAVTVASRHGPLSPNAERRLTEFTELVATAIANAGAREELSRIVKEQSALRRIATLVAEGATPSALFDAVAVEMERLLGADSVSLARYEQNEQVTALVGRVLDSKQVPRGTRVCHRGENVITMVRNSGQAARLESVTQGSPDGQESGPFVSVGAPIVVQGQLWGVAMADWSGENLTPADTEERMAQFAQLLETAVANADSLNQLMASRARLVTAGDAARRRVVRDVHDGAQQRLVHTIITLKLARQAFRENPEETEALVAKALEHAEQGHAELRELVHGILPAPLTTGGIAVGIDALVGRLDLPVRIDVPAKRFEPEIEASAYFIVAEALTNVVKHSRASAAEVRAYIEDGMLHVEVRDDGVGGADCDGHGLVGLSDRATALGGRLEVESSAGSGTVVAATLPLSVGR